MGLESVEEFLAKSLLLRECDAGVIAKVIPHLLTSDHPVGSVLVRAGAANDGITILRSGRATAALVHATSGASTPFETINPGDHFGDVPALTKGAHPYTITADEPCNLVRIRPELVDALIQRVPQVSTALARRIAARSVQLGVAMLRASAAAGRNAAQATPLPTQVPDEGRRAGTATQIMTDMSASTSTTSSSTIQFVEVSDFEPNQKLIAMLPSKLLLRHRAIPLRLVGNKLLVGMVLPRNMAAVADLRRVLHTVDFEVAAISQEDFANAIVRLKIDITRGGGEGARGDAGAMITPESLTFDSADAEREAEKAVRVVGDEVVRAVARIVAAALTRDASDIHIEPEASCVKVRFRVHGMLQDWADSPPPSLAKGIVARLKVLSGLDITNTRTPQDGRIGVSAGARELDLRLSTLPSSRGEKVVMRILDGAGMMRPLEQIYADPGAVNAVRRALQRPHGAIIVAGATGSGKSSSLYSMLNERRKNRPDTNMMLIEDPIEYRLHGVTQVQINTNIGLGFAQVLRAALRQDPDVIAVGETRDADTAHMALEAAMTGHLVLTSMHANDVGSVLQRLESLGCGRTLIAESISFVVVQRLARKLCQACVRVDTPPPALLENLISRRIVERGSQVQLPRPVGCDACQQTGYQGRLAVTEWWQLTTEAREALSTGATHADVLKSAYDDKMFQSFAGNAAYLMARKLLGTSEALMSVAG